MAGTTDRWTPAETDDKPMRLRAPLSRWVFNIALLSGSALIGSAMGSAPVWWLPFFGALCVASAVDLLWLGVTLTPSTLEIHNWRPRRVPWNRIQSITISTDWGVPAIEVWSEGRRTRLRYPHGGFFGTVHSKTRLERQYQLLLARKDAARDDPR